MCRPLRGVFTVIELLVVIAVMGLCWRRCCCRPRRPRARRDAAPGAPTICGNWGSARGVTLSGAGDNPLNTALGLVPGMACSRAWPFNRQRLESSD